MAKATLQNTGRRLDIEDPDPAEMAVLRYFRAHGLAARESRRFSAFRPWLQKNAPELGTQAIDDAIARLIEKGWVGSNPDQAVWLTDEGWREANR